MVPQVVLYEGGDEVVAVIVAVLHAQLEGLAGLAHSLTRSSIRRAQPGSFTSAVLSSRTPRVPPRLHAATVRPAVSQAGRQPVLISGGFSFL